MRISVIDHAIVIKVRPCVFWRILVASPLAMPLAAHKSLFPRESALRRTTIIVLLLIVTGYRAFSYPRLALGSRHEGAGQCPWIHQVRKLAVQLVGGLPGLAVSFKCAAAAKPATAVSHLKSRTLPCARQSSGAGGACRLGASAAGDTNLGAARPLAPFAAPLPRGPLPLAHMWMTTPFIRASEPHRGN